MTKDNFSKQANLYAKFRPKYPAELYKFLLSYVRNWDNAWDCATGNGQVAGELAKYFGHVYATDISQKQLDNAPKFSNVTYSISQAESTDFPDETFDLITIGQAIHWFNFENFFKEVYRVSKSDSILAFWGYSLMSIDNPILDGKLKLFYTQTTHEYWDEERRFLDEAYLTIPLPFTPIPSPDFEMTYTWNLSDLEGYLNTWSSVQKYIQIHQENPVDEFIADISETFDPSESFKVTFPLFLKLGYIKS